MKNKTDKLDTWQAILTEIYQFPRERTVGMRNFIQKIGLGFDFFPAHNPTEKNRWDLLIQKYALGIFLGDLFLIPKLTNLPQKIAVMRFSWHVPEFFCYFSHGGMLRITGADVMVGIRPHVLEFKLKGKRLIKLSDITETAAACVGASFPQLTSISMMELLDLIPAEN